MIQNTLTESEFSIVRSFIFVLAGSLFVSLGVPETFATSNLPPINLPQDNTNSLLEGVVPSENTTSSNITSSDTTSGDDDDGTTSGDDDGTASSGSGDTTSSNVDDTTSSGSSAEGTAPIQLKSSLVDNNLDTTLSNEGSVLKDNSVTSPKIKDGSIKTQDLGAGVITSEKLAPGVPLHLTVTQHTSESGKIPGSQQGSAIAYCSEGEVVTGGGYIKKMDDVDLGFYNNGPVKTSEGEGWTVSAWNTNPRGIDNEGYTVYVICAK